LVTDDNPGDISHKNNDIINVDKIYQQNNTPTGNIEAHIIED